MLKVSVSSGETPLVAVTVAVKVPVAAGVQLMAQVAASMVIPPGWPVIVQVGAGMPVTSRSTEKGAFTTASSAPGGTIRGADTSLSSTVTATLRSVPGPFSSMVAASSVLSASSAAVTVTT